MKSHSILLLLPVVSAKLTPDLAAKIPHCAQQCVQSFLNVNYNENKHGSLKDLCLHNGASGFTLGEGAMQCLMALKESGHCSESDSSREVIYGAYSICNAVKGAIRPTHGVITATLAVAPTGGDVTFPSIQPDPSSTAFSQTTTSSDVLSTAESTTTLTTSTSTSTPTPTPASPIATSPHHLPPTKIAGIVTGSLVGLAALIGGFIVARHFINKRRNRPSRTWNDKDSHNGSSSSELPPPRIYQEMHTIGPTGAVYNRESYRSSAIGLALPTPAKSSPGLTPPTQAVLASRPVSRLLPEKPNLPSKQAETAPPAPSSPTIRAVPFEPPTLQVQSATPTTIHTTPSTPPRSNTPPAIIASPPPARSSDHPVPRLQLRTPKHADFKSSAAFGPPPIMMNRESVGTEFEEDGQQSDIGFKSPLTPAGETFRLPTGGLNSAYVSDGHGNWRIQGSQLESPSSREQTPQRPKLAEAHTSSSEALPQEQRQSVQSASSSQFHRATEALALSNRAISSAIPPTPNLPHESLRLSKATMPSPLFNKKNQGSPRSVSQPTLQHVPIPRPNQTPRSVSANQRPSYEPSQLPLPTVAESSRRPPLRQNQPNFAIQPPAHHHYNPDIPHSSDDRASLPSRARYHRPPSNIQHNFPINPRPRAGPGGNPYGTPYPDSRYPTRPQQQRPTNPQPHQNNRLYPQPVPQQRQHRLQEYQRQSQPRETPYPEEPRSLWEKRQGAKASPISINYPAGSGDPRWQRRGEDATATQWMDQ